ncbi:ribosomal protein S18 acetylase RimI-like enzyme [Jatrophihabitans sp. GAS493]|uniref:GNAT family N-acetyltransferase n=1 Tax=Jatrophihabitans sp. GAS493 TaxID=1907575 RepID=UPI000BB6E4F0|nr:GNAT family N-acetyltransferase [Jatrophihabitans sp. GAS493]SOD72269.1 ribosomal protein S18 acetylase RimI-like enzyme [Jatrophihabitans sp. GAS493]
MRPETAPFRLAEIQDASELTRLIQSAYRGDSSRQGWTTEADLLDGQRVDEAQVLEVITDPQSLLLVLPDADGILACCQLESRADSVVYFGMFAVRPGAQGGGVGRLMIAEAQRLARKTLGATAMEMTVIAQRDELISWYERLGFRRTGETRPFPYGELRFGAPRRDDLHFVVLRRDLSSVTEDTV